MVEHHAASTELDSKSFNRLVTHAPVARSIIALFSAWLFCTGFFWPPTDRKLWHVEWLDVRPGFMVCGVGVIYALWPQFRRFGLAWLALVGLVTVGRWTHILLTINVPIGEEIRSFGWVLQWCLALICHMQVIAARALEGRLR